LIAAKDARVEEQWVHTASLMALIGNCHRTSSGPKLDVYTFHPYLTKPPTEARVPKAGELKNLFDRKGKK